MQKSNIYLSSLFFFIVVSFLIISCDDKENASPLTPVISSISIDVGKPGDILIITGNNFGTDPSKVKVKFHRIEATNIVSISDNRIELIVPAGLEEATVNITVQTGNVVSNHVPFSYMNPSESPFVASITATCFYGAEVVITGLRFSPRIEDNIVQFGNVNATVTKATKDSLTVIAPDLGSAASAKVTVTRFDRTSNSKSISIDLDQNKIATYNWTMHTVRPGVIYKTGQFTLFGATTRRIHVLDVTLDDTNTLGIGFSSSNKTTVAMCNDYDAVVGINAGYFPMSGTTDKDPYIRIGGVTIQEGHTNVNPLFTNAALIIHNNVATVRKFTESGRNLNRVAAETPVSEAQNIIVCGPILVSDGRIESQDLSNSHNTSNTARTGLGVAADGKRVLMVVVDYNQGATGVQTMQLAKILQALGSTHAMNFDGGGSSTMFVKDQGDGGRVSINTYVQRLVKSVIYVK